MNCLYKGVEKKSLIVVLFIYWCLVVLVNPDVPIVKYSFLYFCHIVPIGTFILLSLLLNVYNRFNNQSFVFERQKGWLELYFLWGGASIIVSLTNLDWGGLRFSLLWVGIIYSIRRLKIVVTLFWLNTLLSLSVLASIVTYHLGINQFGYIFGMSTWNCFELERVSLYPSLFDSAFVSFIVFLYNSVNIKRWYNYAFALLSLYFVVLSGNRTVYVCLALFVIYTIFKLILSRANLLKVFLSFLAFLGISSAILVTRVDIGSVLNRPTGIVIADKYLLHQSSHEYCIPESDRNGNRVPVYAHGFGRKELIQNLLNIYLQNPFLGSGKPFLSPNDSRLPDHADGSESFLLSLFARFGSVSFLFVASFCMLALECYRRKSDAAFMLCVCLFVTWLFFGSSANVYNFNFLLCMTLLLGESSSEEFPHEGDRSC